MQQCAEKFSYNIWWNKCFANMFKYKGTGVKNISRINMNVKIHSSRGKWQADLRSSSYRIGICSGYSDIYGFLLSGMLKYRKEGMKKKKKKHL